MSIIEENKKELAAQKKSPKKTTQDAVDLVKEEKTADEVDKETLDKETFKIRSKEARKQEYIDGKAKAKAARIADQEKRKAERKVKKPVIDKETQIAEFIKDFDERKAAGHSTFTEKEGSFKFMLFMPSDIYKALKIMTIKEETTISKLFAKQMAKLVKE
jgi:hypothetical protein